MTVERERRLAENEALAREVNEAVKDVAEDWFDPDEQIEFRCECARATCTEPVSLTRREYESIRVAAVHFVVVAGHEEPEIELAAGRIRDYLLVEKVGAARDKAEETDPRS